MLQDEQERLEKDRRADHGADEQRIDWKNKRSTRSVLCYFWRGRKRSVKYLKIAIQEKYFDSFYGEKVKPYSVYTRYGSGTDNYKSTKEALISVQYNPFCS